MIKMRYILFSALLFGCQEIPELPEPSPELSAFGIQGLLDGHNLSLAVGRNGMALQPEVDRFGPVYELKSTLFSTQGPEQVELSIRDFRLSAPGDPLLTDSILRLGVYPFQLGHGPAQLVNLHGLPSNQFGNPVTGYEWTIHSAAYDAPQLYNGQDLQIPVHPLQPVLVKLSASHQNNCNSSLQQLIDVSNDCKIDLSYGIGSSVNTLRIDTSGFEVDGSFTYYWILAGQIHHDPYLLVDLNDFPPVFPVSLVVESAGGCVQRLNRNILADPTNFCAVNFNFEASNDLHYELRTLRLAYTDPNGQLYSSSAGVQPNWSSVQLDAIEAYTDPNDGSGAIKISGQAACRLFSEDGSFKDFRAVQFSWALPAQP